jgi:hypothetical protein
LLLSKDETDSRICQHKDLAMTKRQGEAEAAAAKGSKKHEPKVTREKTRTRDEVRKESVVHKQNSQKGWKEGEQKG